MVSSICWLWAWRVFVHILERISSKLGHKYEWVDGNKSYTDTVHGLRTPGTTGVKMLNNTLGYWTWSEEPQMQDENDNNLVKGQQRSNGVNYILWLPHLVRKTEDASLRMMMTFIEVKGQQRSNEGNYVMAIIWGHKNNWKTTDVNAYDNYISKGQK